MRRAPELQRRSTGEEGRGDRERERERQDDTWPAACRTTGCPVRRARRARARAGVGGDLRRGLARPARAPPRRGRLGRGRCVPAQAGRFRPRPGRHRRVAGSPAPGLAAAADSPHLAATARTGAALEWQQGIAQDCVLGTRVAVSVGLPFTLPSPPGVAECSRRSARRSAQEPSRGRSLPSDVPSSRPLLRRRRGSEPVLEPADIGVEDVTRDESGADPAGDGLQLALADQGADVVLGAAELRGDLADGQGCRPLHTRSIASACDDSRRCRSSFSSTAHRAWASRQLRAGTRTHTR